MSTEPLTIPRPVPTQRIRPPKKNIPQTAEAPLPADAAEVLNMRVESAEDVCDALLNNTLKPNLPEGKPTPEDAPAPVDTEAG